jgi:ABC-2 type transport system permease protein
MSNALVRDLKGVYTIWYRDLLRFFRDRSRIVGSLGMPLLFLIVFGSGFGGALSNMGGATGSGLALNFQQFMFPGILGMTVLFTSIMSALSIVWDREFGFLKEVLVAPVSRVAVALGKVAGGSTIAMIQGGIILLLAPLIGVKVSVLQIVHLLLLMLLLAMVMSSLGILLAARQKSMEGFQVIMQFVLMPMLFLSGAFFPISTSPDWMKAIMRINPVSYGVDVLRQVALSESVPKQVLAGLSMSSVGFDVLVLAVFGVVFLVPAVLLFSKQD